MANKIKRTDRILLNEVGENKFQVTLRNGDMLLSADEDFFIYFKNVNFLNNGVIEGTYQGENPIIDNHCVVVINSEGKWVKKSNGKPVRTGRLVAVKNNEEVIVIIENT